MGLGDKLRDIEEKSSSSVQRKIDRAREEWADAERRIRRKMRIYPERGPQAVALEPDELRPPTPLPIGGRGARQLQDPEYPEPAKPIVSIHGRDVSQENQAEDETCGHLTQSR